MQFKYPVKARLVIRGSPAFPDNTECEVNHRVNSQGLMLYHCTLLNSKRTYSYIDERFLMLKSLVDFNKDLAELLK